MGEKPKVFISYSWDNQEHCAWVVKLACILISNDVIVLIDRYDVFLGSNLDIFMSEGLNQSKLVICVCSDCYIEKMNKPNTGVGKETEIIHNLNRSDFVIPILRNNCNRHLPESLEDKFYLDFDKEPFNDQINELLERIYGVDKEFIPILGHNPFDKTSVHKRIIDAEIQKTTYISPDVHGEVTFNYSDNNGQYNIGTGKYSFTTQWSKAGKTRIHAYKDPPNIKAIGLIKQVPSIDEINNIDGVDFTSRTRTPEIGDCIVWINDNGNIALTRICKINDDTRGDSSDSISFEYKILTLPI